MRYYDFGTSFISSYLLYVMEGNLILFQESTSLVKYLVSNFSYSLFNYFWIKAWIFTILWKKVLKFAIYCLFHCYKLLWFVATKHCSEKNVSFLFVFHFMRKKKKKMMIFSLNDRKRDLPQSQTATMTSFLVVQLFCMAGFMRNRIWN